MFYFLELRFTFHFGVAVGPHVHPLAFRAPRSLLPPRFALRAPRSLSSLRFRVPYSTVAFGFSLCVPCSTVAPWASRRVPCSTVALRLVLSSRRVHSCGSPAAGRDCQAEQVLRLPSAQRENECSYTCRPNPPLPASGRMVKVSTFLLF